MLRRRFATALLLAPLVLGAILLGQWTVLALVIAVVSLAAYELSQALNPLPFTAALGAGVFPVLLSVPFGVGGVLGGAVLALPWALFWLSGRPEARTLRALLALMLMPLWVGAPMAMLVLIERAQDGVLLILIAVVGPWVSDSGAYFAGRLLGRHPMFPSLSPKKTIEGALGGLALTMAAVMIVGYYMLGLSLLQAALAGAVVSAFSQSGDLFESLLKRMMEIKDLGNTLPGHGGILDRIDSLLFTAPAVYYVFLLL